MLGKRAFFIDILLEQTSFFESKHVDRNLILLLNSWDVSYLLPYSFLFVNQILKMMIMMTNQKTCCGRRGSLSSKYRERYKIQKVYRDNSFLGAVYKEGEIP